MCGLVGFFAPNTTTDANLQNFANMLVVDQIRGMHATGVAKVNTKTNTVTVHKRADNAVDFLSRDDTKEFLSKDRGQIYIGHNRYATMGDKGDHHNAHPFQADHITLVHNGVVDAHAMHLLTGMAREDVKVDSHGVALTIAEHGTKKAVTEHLSGGFALVWWNSEDRTLNFIRNPDRPLYMAVLTDGSLVWASEQGMLDVFFKRPQNRGLSYRMEPTMIEHSTHIKFKFNEHGVRIGQGPVLEGMQFLDLPFPKSQATNGWWDNYSNSSTVNRRTTYLANNDGNSSTTVESQKQQTENEKRQADRVNAVLEERRSPLRFKEVLTLDIKEKHIYHNNAAMARIVGVCRKSGAEIDIWGLSAAKVEHCTIVRAILTNAFPTTIRGVTGVTISADFASASVFDTEMSKRHPVPYYLAMWPSQEQQQVMRAVAAQRNREILKAASDKTAATNPGISYPFKTQGHTFMSSEEFVDFVGQGCDTCGTVPTPYRKQNHKMIVRGGSVIGASLDDCTFTCGDCGEM